MKRQLITFADATVLLTENLESLQDLMNHKAKSIKEYGIQINYKKSKYMKYQETPPGRLAMNDRMN